MYNAMVVNIQGAIDVTKNVIIEQDKETGKDEYSRETGKTEKN